MRCRLIIILCLFLSCKDKTSNLEVKNNLQKMLYKHSLDKSYFNDSIQVKFFNGWKSLAINKLSEDSLLNYYYSSEINPTYTLATNYVKNMKLEDSLLYFNFIDNNKKRLHLGLLMKYEEESAFDFCWVSDSIFYLLENSKKKYYLNKFIMKNDTVTYYINK